MVTPRTWIRKEVVFYSWKQTTRRMGQSRRADDDNIQWKRTPSPPIHESIVSRSAQKQRWWKKSIHFCAERLKLFFAQLFLLNPHSLVCKQTCSSSHKMDKSMWPTFSSFDFIHSSHKWLPTMQSCGKHGQALSIGFISRLRLCWRPWRLKINLRCLVYFWEVELSSQSVGCAKSKLQFRTVLQNLKSFRLMLVYDWTSSLLLIYGCGDRSVTFIE